MKKNTKRKLRRFLTAHARKHLTLTVILYLGILSILLFPPNLAENQMAWFGGYVACPIICIFLTRTIVVSFRKVLKQMSQLETEGLLESVLEDFSKAEKEMGGNLYIGSLGLYGKGSSRIALYRDMTHLYSVLSDRRGQHPRDLRYEDSQGGDHFLCELDPIGDSNIEIEQLYRRTEKRHPHIKTGR
jgi:hypothetical protein